MASTGPPWNDLFVKNADGEIVGAQREVIGPDGNTKTITVDDAYIIESIKDPNALKVAKPPYNSNNMTAFPQLDDKRLNGIIEYMKTLAEQQ